MNNAPIKKAFVLAAGLGERMRPLTDNCPKPLIAVGGQTMLDRALDSLAAAGVEEVVVNTHYLGQMIAAHLKDRKVPRITISHEETLLDTGGGVKKMLPFFGSAPFYVLNADILWLDGAVPTLEAMAREWDSKTMDLLLLLYPTAGGGDYTLGDGETRPVFAKGHGNTIFAGPRIVHPRLFDGAPEGKFGFIDLFHKAEKAGRLFAHRHDGAWYHVGTPEALAETNRLLSDQKTERAARAQT